MNQSNAIPLLDNISLNDKRTRKASRQQRKIDELSRLPLFQPLKPYKIYFVNHMTPLMVIFSLLDLARTIKAYTIDTEGDIHTNRQTLIQIEFIDDTNEQESVVLLVEMAHLPHPTTRRFYFIQKLFAVILNSSNLIYTWDNVQKELQRFLHYEVFNMELIQSMNMVDIQGKFKTWYNRQFPHDFDCFVGRIIGDDPSCDCKHRPYKHTNDKWSLQMAIAKIFHEYLDKTCRKSTWSIGLDERLDPLFQHASYQQRRQNRSFQYRQHRRDKLSKYAVYDCLSVTKIVMLVKNDWTYEPVEQYET